MINDFMVLRKTTCFRSLVGRYLVADFLMNLLVVHKIININSVGQDLHEEDAS